MTVEVVIESPAEQYIGGPYEVSYVAEGIVLAATEHGLSVKKVHWNQSRAFRHFYTLETADGRLLAAKVDKCG